MACFVWTISTTYLVLNLLALMCDLRVSDCDENDDLDISQLVTSAYPNFQQTLPYQGMK